MSIIAVLEGLISSVPEAVQLYHRIAPLIGPRADISQEEIDHITAIAPDVHAVVTSAHRAIVSLIDAHSPIPETAKDAPAAG